MTTLDFTTPFIYSTNTGSGFYNYGTYGYSTTPCYTDFEVTDTIRGVPSFGYPMRHSHVDNPVVIL